MFIRGKKKSGAKSAVLAVLFVAAVIAGALAVGSYSRNVDERSFTLISDSVKRAAVQCYALEGYYPPTVQYLRDNYGLSYDENKYSVQYRFMGDNIMPDITVIQRG